MKNGYCEDRGFQSWWVNDELHREDGPAIIYPSDTQVWYLHNKRHREDGPAYIEINGHKEWWVNGKRHREDGPAYIESNGTQYWFINDIYITDEVNTWFEDCNITYESMEFEDKMALKFFIRGLAT